MRVLAITSTFASLLMLAACGKGPAPEQAAAPAAAPAAAAPVSTVTSRQIMLGLIIPAADVVWGAGSTAPADDAAWEKLEANAAMIAEAGNLMMTGARVVDQGEWLTDAKALVDAATAAAKAANAKNLDGVSDAGNVMYDTCDTCHKKYMVARGGV
jgi:hypothetical protein